ncbi:MAG TPA: nucleotidyltransferase family protein [Longimicrobium sp.]|nr:nucleotidyltransferase family protein [Longimicrobium sp.]
MRIDPAPLPLNALDESPDQVQRRFRQAHEAGTPRWFWPEIPVARWAAGRREIVRATGDVLAGRTAALDPRGEVGAQALGVAAFTLGMGPLLGHWIGTGVLDAEPETAAVLTLHLEHGRARARKLDAALESALAALASAGVAATVLKGMHTSRTLFPEPGARPMTDVDVVVDPEKIPAAEGALEAAGFVRLAVAYQRRPYHADWRPPGEDGQLRSLMLTHRDSPLTVNLHDEFDRHPGPGRVRLGTPGPADTGAMPGVRTPARVLAGPFLIAYLAAHAGEERETLLLVRLVELVLAMRTVDPAPLRDFLHARRIAHHVYPALALAERLAPGTLDSGFLAWLQAESGPRVRAAVDALDLAMLQRMDLPVAGGRSLAVRGMMDQLRGVLGWLVPYPSAARLAALYRIRWGRLVARMRAR